MAYKHYAPACATKFFGAQELSAAVQCYQNEEAAGGAPCLLCEHAVCGQYPALRALDLGRTPEEMAANLYAHLRTGERQATLLIGVEPRARGGVMDGVLNRMLRAFGQDAKERRHDG